jgi:hypothetical protein
MGGRWVVFSPRGLDIYGSFQSRKGIRYSNLNWVSRLPEELRGGPVVRVDEHGTGAGREWHQPDLGNIHAFTEREEAKRGGAVTDSSGWGSKFQQMADKTGRTIKDLDTGEVFRPRSTAAAKFDYRSWYRQQQEGRAD